MVGKMPEKARGGQGISLIIEHGRHQSTFNSYWLTYMQYVDNVEHFVYERFNFAEDFYAKLFTLQA